MSRPAVALLFCLLLSGPALAQGNAQFCGRYAANVSGMGDLAIKKNPACLDYSKGVHGIYQSHFDWCMKQPAASVQGAEANIRRLVSACTGNAAAKPAAAPPRGPVVPGMAAVPSAPKPGSEEPFGQNIGSWRFTQAPNAFCRGYSGGNVIARYKDGHYRLSVLAKGNPKGQFEGANITIGGASEPINVSSDGGRIYMEVGEDTVAQIVRARGFSWRAWNRSGTAAFDGSVGAAVARLRECTRANGGR